ncbi:MULTISPECIES: hypothetical protein [unclassified Caballeronia]|uniref:hypothetical protein n=1 Tax=unclassified Caballeronia TaxID=2646786 RepID=UPI00285B770C|nr:MULTISPECIES: hypothetical protein [unclassified Caballeronia]MDR5816510.1 hypothetical protein [Caballeronia sp. LZ033]MDR5823181.1 hypothetical protein [Caballeronia sp. LZ043]
MASRIRSLAASAAVLTLLLVFGAAPSTLAATSAELAVSLTIYEVCTLDTDARRPAVACSAAGQYRVLTGQYFADFQVAEADKTQTRNRAVVEIAF